LSEFKKRIDHNLDSFSNRIDFASFPQGDFAYFVSYRKKKLCISWKKSLKLTQSNSFNNQQKINEFLNSEFNKNVKEKNLKKILCR
jgi:hypothetical protein